MFAALISGKTAKQTEVFRGVKQQPPRPWGRAAASGSSHCERTMWQIGHNTRDFRLRRNQHARHEIEELLPWYATGTLSGREAERVEQALAGDRELRTH
jgi:hypothetical protein